MTTARDMASIIRIPTIRDSIKDIPGFIFGMIMSLRMALGERVRLTMTRRLKDRGLHALIMPRRHGLSGIQCEEPRSIDSTTMVLSYLSSFWTLEVIETKLPESFFINPGKIELCWGLFKRIG
jgi:hypothetical protein